MNKKTKIILISVAALIVLVLVGGGYYFYKNSDTTEKAKIQAGLDSVFNPLSGKAIGEKIPKTNPFDADVNPFSAYKNPFK